MMPELVIGLAPAATEYDAHDRRMQVLRGRFRRMSVTKIAQALQIPRETVCADLAWIHRHRDEIYSGEGFRPAEFIGETIDFYTTIAEDALHDAQSPSISATDKARFQMVAITARRELTATLNECGVIARAQTPTNPLGLPTASQIRQALALVTIVDGDVLDPGDLAKRG
jgi:hypothetical protein